jgi:hypothetical protein
MACDICLKNKNYNSIDDKINFLSEENNAKSLFVETTNLLNSKNYLFERRGFYSNPKTEKLIKEIQYATN